MAFIIIDTNTTGTGIQVDMDPGDDVFVSAGVTVGSTNTFAIRGTGNGHLANIQGTVVSASNTISLGASDVTFGQRLVVGADGFVGGFNSGVYAVVILGAASLVENDGTIWGSGPALLMSGSNALTQSKIVNRGLIEGGGFAAITRHNPSSETLVIENSGTIRALEVAFQGSGTGATSIINTGSIFGDIVFNDGADTYYGTQGRIDGAVFGGGGADILFGGAGGDSLGGDAGSDQVRGGGADDLIGGGADADMLWGGTGSDEIDGGTGADQMFGEAGNDGYIVDNAGDVVNESGGNGTDAVLSFVGFNLADTARAVGAVENLTLAGGSAINGTGNALNNIITGNDAVNMIDGGAGNDPLRGMGGNDILIGNAGKDTMTGGIGDDSFRFFNKTHSGASATTADVIADFDDFGNDRIDLTAIYGGVLSYRHNGAFTAAGQVRINDIVGNDLLVEVNTGGTLAADFAIRLAATTLGSMTASDFIL